MSASWHYRCDDCDAIVAVNSRCGVAMAKHVKEHRGTARFIREDHEDGNDCTACEEAINNE